MTALALATSQAEGGRQVFAMACAGCHGAALQGDAGPALAGLEFQAAWRSPESLFGYVTRQMPSGSPASLSREEYLSVVAYLLKQNGIGAEEQ